jgi:helicase domain protein
MNVVNLNLHIWAIMESNMTAPILSFSDVLKKFRREAFSERDKGARFELLMKKYMLSEPTYEGRFKQIWLWNEFPYRKDFSGKDTGIDLVAQTVEGDYWAVQCKCYDEKAYIDKAGVDSFLSTSSKSFYNENMETVQFAQRLWISTTNNWNGEAENTIKNQNPPLIRISLTDLENSNVDWDKLVNGEEGKSARKQKKTPREHQNKAISNVNEYFKGNDRGKLIMACGCGKTYTSLKIAEKETNGNGLVLFLVPSIALLGQTLREWCAESEKPIYPICICSDPAITKKTDNDDMSVVDLALPASTNVPNIIHQYELAKQQHTDGMIVVFSTYQSIDVISKAQEVINKRQKDSCIFDLVICDEAHRTTGVVLKDKEEASFTKVHNNDCIVAKKRMYMTATPRLYTDASKQKAQENDAILCSMDDESIYGQEMYRIGFGEAVSKNLLADYKVLILTLKEEQIPTALQNVISDKTNEINTDDISKLIGCINALSKRVLSTDEAFNDDKSPMTKAVAFCQNIKVSQKISGMFNNHKDAYYDSLTQEERSQLVGVESKHIDGTMGASQRDELLSWLKNAPKDSNECHILTNVKCLSEGVDVPSLDAVMFLSAKNSQVDVVQSVGRVMRTAPNKKYGYIIIPIVVPSGVKPEEALDDNERYKVVWTVLNALRAHDDRFNAEINKIDLNKKKNNKIIVGGIGSKATDSDGDTTTSSTESTQLALPLPEIDQLQNAIYAKMVQKVGNKRYWVQWAQDVAQIAQRYIERINLLIATEGKHKKAFDSLLKGLQKNINPSVSKDEVIQMLAQHLITQPVFEALFENYSFVQNNAVSKSLQKMIDLLEEQAMDKDAETLNKFYESVKERVEGIDNAEGKQKIIVELYDKFFKTAFPKTVEQLGIVYTPVEVVDFINHSVAKVLKKEFNRNLSDENVHILDPFTGTGTFITRLIQTGLIDKEALPQKYAKELHANEIVLLAYYIASINIENAYHDAVGQENGYKPFNGICLTDTFQLGEADNADELFSDMLPQNSERVMEQKKLPVRVIIGNPPYSVGQKSANDNAQNQKYPRLDGRIADTYVKTSTATNPNKIYDSYIKAFRWSSDRIDNEHGGIIGFITNGIWLDNSSFDGFRKSLEKEFSSIYVFNLRGGIKGKSGDNAKREGQNVFDIMTGVAITILVKNPKQCTDKATIYYHDIGEYLKRTEKLGLLSKFESINNSKIEWKALKPNEHGDWLSQRSDLFNSFIPIDATKKYTNDKSFFTTYSLGVATSRDSWCYNYSYQEVKNNMSRMICFYNTQSQQYIQSNKNINDFIDTDKTKISWNDNLKNDLKKGKLHRYIEDHQFTAMYRPFCQQILYYDKDMNARRYQQPKIFPALNMLNLCICVSSDARNGCSILISNLIPDLSFVPGAQCFPLYYYEENKGNIGTLFDQGKENYIRRDGITDFILEQCETRYGHKVVKEDIFYYVYGLLHSKDYREQFAADLKKMLPRIPLVDVPNDFWAFSKAGRELAELHLNYESVPAYPDVKVIGEDSEKYYVEKLSFGKNGKEVDKSILIYNSYIRIENIPLEAYDYIINGKSAIEWIMDRYQVKIDKDSGIKNDPNDWGLEHNNPRYILDLILSIITVSMATNEIVKRLPKLEFK